MFIILAGILLICFATYGLYTGYSEGNWLSSGMAFGGILLGALVTLFGFGKRASERMGNPNDAQSDHAHVEIRALIQSIGVVAVADGQVRDQEVTAIANIHERMLGMKIKDQEIREILSELGTGFDITKHLVETRGKISPAMKRIIVQSCHLVMVSDLEIVKPEENRVNEIGLALGFDQSEIEDLIASAEV